MSSRKRRSSSRQLQEAGCPDPDVLVVDEEEPPRRKKRSTSAASAGAAAAADSHADTDPTAAAAAAAAAADGSNGAGPSGEAARERQPRVVYNQLEADIMMDQIKELDEDAQAALDIAANMDIQQTTLDAAVARVVRFLLFRHHEKPGVPVKRQDINEVVSGVAGVAKGSKAAKKLPGLVMPLMAAKLASTFGMELRELKKGDTGAAAAAAAAAAPAAAGSSGPAAAAAGGGAAATGTQTYKLLSMLPLDLLARYGQQPQDHQERGFVTIVLALLQLKQYKMDEEELWRHLQQLGIEREDQDAAVPFGKHPTKIIESMEHSRYLLKSKGAAPNTERGTLITYEWGEAAHSEFGGGALEGIVTQFLEAPADADN